MTQTIAWQDVQRDIYTTNYVKIQGHAINGTSKNFTIVVHRNAVTLNSGVVRPVLEHFERHFNESEYAVVAKAMTRAEELNVKRA